VSASGQIIGYGCKALMQGLDEIEAVRFIQDPEPDYIGVHPDDLPY
jgi:hypothetical protein